MHSKTLFGELFKHVRFAAEGNLRFIDGFIKCLSLYRIEILASVLIDFQTCRKLNEIAFAANGHLVDVHAFDKSASLYRIEFPASVQEVSEVSKCRELKKVIGPTGNQLFRIIFAGQETFSI
jgi:hypothetical protein